MDPDFDRFEKKVDEIGNIIKGLCSKDEEEVSKATLDADSYLSEESDSDNSDTPKSFNRTIINKESKSSHGQETQSKEAFMAMMEKDARARAEDRKRRNALAEQYRSSANNAFALGDYTAAVDLFTKALAEVKDKPVLYVGRAVALLKLGLHKRMLEDCDMALRAHGACLRAWLLKARALFELHELERADECVREAKARAPHRARDVDAYVATWRWRKAESEDEEGEEEKEFQEDDSEIPS